MVMVLEPFDHSAQPILGCSRSLLGNGVAISGERSLFGVNNKNNDY